ncbi:hypothetical protein CRUP_017118 [Coryphaenoides rupestris]|nr:hypothetical protein CRUP_017118 [Coryphaenoides rupestris]
MATAPLVPTVTREEEIGGADRRGERRSRPERRREEQIGEEEQTGEEERSRPERRRGADRRGGERREAQTGDQKISGECLSGSEVRDVCEALRADGARLLSLRGCQLSDRDFVRVCRGVAAARGLAHLNLNLGVVSGAARATQLADALLTNRSLQTLFLHGSPLLDSGLVTLNPALCSHPSLVSLDLGDCLLGDQALGLIWLRELTLSANPGISTKGWARLAVAVAHSSQLRVLNLDYNPLGDQIAGMLAVAVASSRTLEVLDLEGTGLSNHAAQVFLDMVQNYPTSLRVLVLAENDIAPELQQQISDLLSEGEGEGEEDEDRQAPPTQPSPAYSSDMLPTRDKHHHHHPQHHHHHAGPWVPYSNSSPHVVVLTSGLGDSLLAETEM